MWKIAHFQMCMVSNSCPRRAISTVLCVTRTHDVNDDVIDVTYATCIHVHAGS